MKYLIYQGDGGLAHNIYTLSQAIDYANKSNRILIIKNNFKFTKYFTTSLGIFINIKKIEFWLQHRDCIKHLNNINDILQITDNNKLTIKDILNNDFFYKNKKGFIIIINYNKYILSDKYFSDDMVTVYSGYMGSENINLNIVVNDYMKKKIKTITENKFNNNYLSIHFRNTDMKHDMSDFVSTINNSISLLEKKNIKNIHLATDDLDALYNFKKKLSKFEVIQIVKLSQNTKCKFCLSLPQVQTLIGMAIQESSIENYKLAKDYFIEAKNKTTQIRIKKFIDNLLELLNQRIKNKKCPCGSGKKYTKCIQRKKCKGLLSSIFMKNIIKPSHLGANSSWYINNSENIICNCKGIHFDDDSEKVIVNALIDIYLILNSKYFLLSYKSSFSVWIREMIIRKKNIFNTNTFPEILN